MVPCAVAAWAGALSIPRSDDWSYLLTLFRLVDDGRLGFNNWVSMTLIGQIALAAPIAAVLPDSITAVHIGTAVLGFVGLVAVVLAAEPRHRSGAFLLAATIAVGPLWAPLAATFMTDVPSFAVQTVFLALAFWMLRRETVTPGRYAATLAVGVLAISIRQYEIIPVVIVVGVCLWSVAGSGDRSRLRPLLAITAVAALATAALLGWWLSLPDSLSLAPSPVTSGVIANLAVRLAGFVRLIALLVLPVVVLLGPTRVIRDAWRRAPLTTVAVGGFVAFWMTVTSVRVPDIPFVGNYVDIWGVLSRDVVDGARVPVMPVPAFRLLAVMGSAAAVVLALAIVPFLVETAGRVRDRRIELGDPVGWVLASTLVGFAAAYAFAIATDLPVFDRYALPLLPVVGLMVLRRRDRAPLVDAPAARGEGDVPRTRPLTVAGIAASLVLLAAVGLVYATDSASFDGTRWKVDERVVAKGWSPLRIYGGFEWISWHQRTGPPQGDAAAERQRLRAIYLKPFCVDVIVNPRPRVAERAIARATMYGLGHGAVPVVAVRNERPCPPLSQLRRAGLRIPAG